MNALFDFGIFRKSVDQLAAQIRKIRDDIETRKQRREDLTTLPVSREELAAEICTWIDQQRAGAIQDMQKGITSLLGDPCSPISETNHIPLLNTAWSQRDTVSQRFVLLLLGEQIKDAIPGMLDKLDYPEQVGPPREARMRELEKLDKEIIALERSEADLIQQAAAAGIRVEPLGPLTSIKR